jgi:CHAT domain-containing protein
MVDMHASDCLESEVLAAYVDHGLSLAERARVERHLASCPQCTAQLAGVVRTVAEISPALPHTAEPAEATPLVSRRGVASGALAAAAVIAVLAAPSLLKPWLDRDTGLVGLAGNVGEHRSVLGRLTGGLPHAPLDAASAGGQDVRASGTDGVLLTAGRIRESVGELATPSRLHALGVAQLFERRYDDAAELLLAASRQQPANPRYLNDAATVQLERARLGLRPDDLPRALAAADRARRLDPSLHEAWFNRALAMSALQLTDQAKLAWAEYLGRDGASPWADEARKHLEALSKPTPAAAWAEIEGRLQQQIDSSSADAAVRAQTTEARNFIENHLIVAWADAVLAGDSGDAELDRLRLMADAMARVTGDAIYNDVVAAIVRSGSKDTTRRLAQAHKTFADASSLFNRDAFEEAGKLLPVARNEFVALSSPFSVLADIQLAAIDFVGGRQERADASFAATLAAARTRNYGYASARCSWFRGLIAYGQGRIAEAQSSYEDTLAAFERMGDVEQGSMAHILLSGVHDLLGDTVSEWRHRQSALAGLNVSRSSRFRYTILLSGALSIRDEHPEAALVMLEGVVAEARATGRDAAIVDGLAQRATTLHKLGRRAEADKTAKEARAHLSNVRDEAFRRMLEIPILAVESDLLRAANAPAAAIAAQHGIDIAVARRDRTRLPQLYLRLAKANIVSGRLDQAERALTAGMAAFDETRAKPTGITGIAAFDESWELYETATQLAIRRGDRERAFAMAERGRARNVVASSPITSLANAQRLQAADQAIVAMNQFDDELVLWVIRQQGTTIVRRPLRRADAREIVARQHDEIRLQTQQPAASAALFDEILRPLAATLEGATRIVFVPDTAYNDASFAALWDRATRRYAVEKWTVTGAPTVSLALSSAGRRSEAESVLVLSADANDHTAQLVASSYPGATFVGGAEATRSRLLSHSSAILHVAARAHRNAAFPSWSQLRLNDEPGLKYSGTVVGRDIATRQMPNTALVVLDELTPEQSYRTAGTLDLATAFLAAGVPAVLGTLPGADERSTRELMVGFHRQLTAQVPAAEALARVQRDALQQNGRRLGAWTALVLYGSDR